jgi:light-regulated signal transduction histidine kinase (bacteriophytochrome)
MRRFHRELQQQASTMVTAAQHVSARFTNEYREAILHMASESKEKEGWTLALVVGGLVLAWIITKYFLGRQIISRLQEVSKYLREGGTEGQHPRVPVQGRDEIGQMARAVEQFLEDRERLAEVNRELEAFSYSVSHDLRAPLRAIDGFSQILQEDYTNQLDEEGRDYLERIRHNAIRMRDLIDDILNFSRTSRREMETDTLNLATLAQEVFEEVRGTVPERKIALRFGELPLANGDRALMRQVLVNLISNAVKFTAPRAEAVIEIDCVNQGDQNTYRVKDNGVGFDMQYADKLFGVFQRLHNSEQFEGTGIGLAIVKRVVMRHGGRVWAESKPGEGTSIYFTLPRAGPNEAQSTLPHPG